MFNNLKKECEKCFKRKFSGYTDKRVCQEFNILIIEGGQYANTKTG